jgi:3'-5' exoribonuclease
VGGLAEHTLSVVSICEFLGGRYKYVDMDLLITAAILHDLGKVYELSPFPENDYTDDGQLLGHIVIMAARIEKEASNIPGFPRALKSLLTHCVISHHGEYVFGSPELPKTIEAFILHCADNSDAKLKMIEEAVGKDKSSGDYTGYHKILARSIRKPEKT